jgi:hypothetical protein
MQRRQAAPPNACPIRFLRSRIKSHLAEATDDNFAKPNCRPASNDRATTPNVQSLFDILALFRVMNRYVGNLPPMPGVYPNCLAPSTTSMI